MPNGSAALDSSRLTLAPGDSARLRFVADAVRVEHLGHVVGVDAGAVEPSVALGAAAEQDPAEAGRLVAGGRPGQDFLFPHAPPSDSAMAAPTVISPNAAAATPSTAGTRIYGTLSLTSRNFFPPF